MLPSCWHRPLHGAQCGAGSAVRRLLAHGEGGRVRCGPRGVGLAGKLPWNARLARTHGWPAVGQPCKPARVCPGADPHPPQGHHIVVAASLEIHLHLRRAASSRQRAHSRRGTSAPPLALSATKSTSIPFPPAQRQAAMPPSAHVWPPRCSSPAALQAPAIALPPPGARPPREASPPPVQTSSPPQATRGTTRHTRRPRHLQREEGASRQRGTWARARRRQATPAAALASRPCDVFNRAGQCPPPGSADTTPASLLACSQHLAKAELLHVDDVHSSGQLPQACRLTTRAAEAGGWREKRLRLRWSGAAAARMDLGLSSASGATRMTRCWQSPTLQPTGVPT